MLWVSLYGRVVRKKKAPSKHRKAFGRRLQASRIAAGYATQQDLAKPLGMTVQGLSRWERGETEPGLDDLVILSDLLKQSIDFLIRGESPYVSPTPPKPSNR